MGTRIFIIGSGPTALGAGYRLMELGILKDYHQVSIFEQNDGPGGLSSTVRDDEGFLWDLGGHVIYSHYEKFSHLLDDTVPEWNYHQRESFVLMMDRDGSPRYIPYPIQHNIHHLSKTDQQKCLAGLKDLDSEDQGLSKPGQEKTFHDWIQTRFGSGLNEVFMNPYNRKIWTIDPKLMSDVWVRERVAVPSYQQAAALCSKHSKTDETDWGPNRKFRFPRRGGTGAIWRGVAQKLPSSWIKYEYRVVEVQIDQKRLHLVHLPSQERFWVEYDILISTIPLNLLLKSITGPTQKVSQIKKLGNKFVYNAVHVVGVGLRGKIPECLKDKTWLYLPGDDCPFYRISIFSKYSDDHVPDPTNNWSLLCEASEKVWKIESNNLEARRKEILSQITPSFLKYGIIQNQAQIISIFHRRLDQGYPVPFLKRDKYLSMIQPWLESNNIFSRGRFGGWKYEVSNQDHAFMQGVEVVDRILLGIPELTYYHPKLVNDGLDTGRNQPLKIRNRRNGMSEIHLVPFRSNPDLVYVIAHYNEDLSWLQNMGISDKSYVYHKGGNSVPMFDVWQWESLPNVGREAHTYLTYIINNYHRLPEVIVFLQGRIDDHPKDLYQDPTIYADLARKNEFCFKAKEVYKNWGRIKHSSIFKTKLENGQLKPASHTFGQFWKILYRTDHPEQILISFCAGFGVVKSRILAHPLSFYQKCLSFVSDHPDPEFGHYFERLWYSIMTKGSI